MKEFKPDDIVKTCPYLERGCAFQLRGMTACTTGTKSSPVLASAQALKDKTATYEQIVQRRKEIFEALNGIGNINLEGCKDCCNVREKKYKDVNFEWIGGEPLPAGFNIQHYTMCNERCKYCIYSQKNDFKAPQYDILYVYELFRKKGKLAGNNWIDFSGGEPAMLKNFDETLNYMMDNNMGTIVVYSNSVIFSPSIYKGLEQNKIILTTSLDTGLKSTYANLRGRDYFENVIDTLIRYRNSGTKNLWLKYVITEDNRTDDDLWSFVMAMLAIRPDSVMICPDFPYGDKQIPEETVKFAAKLWYTLDRYLPNAFLQDYTSAFGDEKFSRYRTAMFAEVDRLKNEDLKRMNDVIDSIPDDAKVAIWGIGGMARKLLAETSLCKKNIVKAYDANKDMIGKDFAGAKISMFNPSDVESGKVEYIVIATQRFQSEIVYNLAPYSDKVNIVKLFDRQVDIQPRITLRNASGKALLKEVAFRIKRKIFRK